MSHHKETTISPTPGELPTRREPQYGPQRWTLGDSEALVLGAQKDSRLSAAAWLLLPIIVGSLLLGFIGAG